MICLIEVMGFNPKFIYVSPSAMDTIGWRSEELLYKSPAMIFTEQSMAVIVADIRKISKGGDTSLVVVEAIGKDGRHIWLENRVRVLERKREGMIVLVSMRDVTQRKLLEDQLSLLAAVDGLTGISNRRAFDEAVQREWKRALRSRTPLSLVLVDVDHFKRFNDSYGHQKGDQCLCAIATAVRSCAKREEDVVARYGGEELVMLLPATPIKRAEILANELCSTVADLRIPHAGNPEGGGLVTVSCGVAAASFVYKESASSPDILLRSADTALYRAKAAGRNRVATG